MPECVRLLRLLASARSREGCIDGRGASFAASAVEVLKASGPQGRAVSPSPILVTYGAAMTNTQGLLLQVLAWQREGGGEYYGPCDEARPLEGKGLSLLNEIKLLRAATLLNEACTSC